MLSAIVLNDISSMLSVTKLNVLVPLTYKSIRNDTEFENNNCKFN